jgi:hypothetical protein
MRWHLFLLVLSIFVGTGEAYAQSPPPERLAAFLTALEGDWKGEATKTPIGPRPYDSNFTRTSPERLEGEAHPGSSTIHYWTFYQEEQTLKLRFLSTFRGNQQPLFLSATEEQDGEMIFHTPQTDFLEVRVKPFLRNVTIQIFLRGQPHVEIHLVRRS